MSKAPRRVAVTNYVMDPSSACVKKALEAEARVFTEAFGNSAADLEAEYGQFAEQTQLVVASDPRLVGMARVMLPGPNEPKSFSDARTVPYNLDVEAIVGVLEGARVADIVTLAVPPEHRGFGMGPVLIAGALLLAESAGASWASAIVDCSVQNYLQRCGVHLDPMPGARAAPYLGSRLSIPTLFSVPRVCKAALDCIEQLDVQVRWQISM